MTSPVASFELKDGTQLTLYADRVIHEGAIGIAMNRGGDLVAIHRLAAQERQNQERKRAFEEFGVHGGPQPKESDTSNSYVLPPADFAVNKNPAFFW